MSFIHKYCTVKPVLSDQIKQDIVLCFQIGGSLLLHESSAALTKMKRLLQG